MANLIGQSLGRYHILEQLGEGGMATVYKARDINLERDVAVKVIRAESFGSAMLERILKRFEREAKSLARLTHPNIVPILDYGETNGAPYLVMPYLPGGTLKGRMKIPIPYREAVQMLIPIAQALVHAHQQTIIHRDIKPSNILITRTGEPMLSDFGISKILDSEETRDLTSTGVGIGTPEYMAPEQGMGQADERSDIYALGVVLYEMITGRIPFRADTPMAVLLKKSQEAMPRPKQFVPNLPDSVENVLIKALARDPNNRYQSMQEFLNALGRLLRDETATMAMPQAPTQTGLSSTKISTNAKSNLKWVIAGAGGLLFLAMCGIGLFAVAKLISSPTPAGETQFVPADVTVTSPAAWTEEPVVPPVIDVTVAPPPQPVITPSETPGLAPGQTDQAEMMYISEGQFLMGSDAGATNNFCKENNSNCDGFADASPQHTVFLNAFWIDKYEVTNSMFEKFVSATNYKTDAEGDGYGEVWRGGGSVVEDSQKIKGADWRHPTGPESSIFGLENHPVVQVSWEDARSYCQWAGRRLPTEAEWEMAARGNSASYFPWGSKFNCQLGNYDDEQNIDSFILENGSANCDGFARTAPVGSFSQGQSPYGLFDMSGNVWEWVADWYDKNFYSYSPSANPVGPSNGTMRVYRGGSWFSEMKYLYIPFRQANPPSYRDDITGFRCAMNP